MSKWPTFVAGILILGLVSFYIVYRTSYDNKNADTVNKDTDDDKAVEKLDSNKNYVYSKSEYQITDLGDADTVQDWMRETTFWIKTPVINLNSDTVEDINNIIENNVKTYKNGITYSDLYSDQKRYLTHFTTYDYKYYLNGDILSLVLESQEYLIPSSGVPKEYEVYNIDIKAGTVLTNYNLMSIKQINNNSILTKLASALQAAEISKCPSNQDDPTDNACYNDLTINSDTIMYLNGDNKLVIIIPVTEAGYEGNILNEPITID